MPAIDTGIVYCDDNYQRLAQFPSESVDLIYLDPPFFSNRNYEVIWGDEAEIRSFEDRWEGGVHVYVEWMRDRVMEMHRLLKPTGSFYLHCDWHAVHYLKQMLDAVFGDDQFQNEIIWYYRGAGVSPRRWARRHDNILFYTKGKTWTFNVDPVRDEYAAATKARFEYKVGNVRGTADYGRQALNPSGKHPDDVWELSIVAPSARDRLGYPTQKPEKLMERIILASSNPGDVVLDPFAGCGTTLVVAQRFKRAWVGIDISPTAVRLIEARMRKVGASPKTMGLPVSEDDLRRLKPFEFQNWIIQQMNGTHSPRKSADMGVDGYSFFEHLPIQVKQIANVGRNVVDNFETAVQRSGKLSGYIVAFGFTSGAREEAARARAQRSLDIKLITVADLLQNTQDIVTPSTLFEEQPLPRPRPDDAKPTIEELVASDKSATPGDEPTVSGD